MNLNTNHTQQPQQNKIRKVEVHFLNTRTRRAKLSKITSSISQADVMIELYKRATKTLQYLDSFDSFKSHNVSIYRGATDSDVRVLYRFVDAPVFFRQIRTSFDRSGGAMLQVKLGIRNLFCNLERLSLDYTQAMLKWRNYTLHFSLTVPYITSSAFGYKFGYYVQKRDIEKEVAERARTLQLILFHKDPDLSRALIFEDQARDNSVNQYSRHNSTDRYLKYEDYVPTTKRCLRVNWTLCNNVQRARYTHIGASLKGSAEITLPTSDVQFFKTEINYRHYFQLAKISQRLFRYVNIDYNAGIGIAKSLFGQNLQVNDCFGFKKPRGFEYLDIFIDEMCMSRKRKRSLIKQMFEQVDFYAMTSLRLNLYNYPLFQVQLADLFLKDADSSTRNMLDLRKFQAFYHVSLGYFYRARHGTGIYLSSLSEHMSNHLRVSAGVGISRDITQELRLEVLYNFYHFGQPKDHKLTWQIRLAN